MDQSEQKLVARYIMKRSEDIAVKQAAAAAIDRLCVQYNVEAGAVSFIHNLIELIAVADRESAPMILQEIIRYYQADARQSLRSSLRLQLENITRESKKHLWTFEHLKEAAR